MNKITLFLISIFVSISLPNVVAQENKVGIIDRTGNYVVFPQYDEIDIWAINDDGLVPVKKGDKWGAVDKNGKEVVPPRYDEKFYFQEGIAVVKRNGSYGIIDENGNEIVLSHYKYVSSFVEGLAFVVTDDCEMTKWDNHDCTCCKKGFIDRTGKEIVSPRYGFAYSFSEGLAGVANIKEYDEYCYCLNGVPLYYEPCGCKWGFIDKTGKEVVSLQYEYVGSFNDGLAPVRKDGKWGLIDKTGREIVPPRYDYNPYRDDIIRFYEGLAIVKKDGKYGMIDKTGKEIITPLYDEIGYFIDGLAPVNVGGKWGFIDKTGKIIVQPRYKYVMNEDRDSQHEDGWWLEPVCNDGEKWGFVDKTGKEIVTPRYDEVGDFHEGLASVRIDCGWKEDLGKSVYRYGFIDKNGKEVVPPRYDEVSDFHEGLASVRIDCGWKEDSGKSVYRCRCGFIDKTGTEVIPLQYDYSCFDDAPYFNFHEGFASVKKGDKWGFIDKTGKETITPRYDYVSDFKNGLAIVSVKSDDVISFDNYNKIVQQAWSKSNNQLLEYPYNVGKLQLEPISITNYFMDPRLDAITDSIVRDLRQKTMELQEKCYNNLKTNQPKVFAEVYLQQHSEIKSVLENLKLECRCNNYSEADLVVKIADNVIPECTCRNDYWNQYGTLFSSRSEFDNTYNTSEQDFLNDVKLRQSLKADIQEIASMLSGLNKPKFKDGLTGKNENIIQILQKVQYHQGKYYYDEVIEMMFNADAAMEKEWEKNGSVFSSRNEFYEAYVSGDYKNVLKEKKSK